MVINNELNTIPPRLKSLDALRGFDMFWIMGADRVLVLLGTLSGLPLFEFLGNQMTHAKWHGFHAYDMIFPLFLFISGVTFPFSASKRMVDDKARKDLYRHVIKRGLVLVILGIIYNNGVSFDFSNLRYASVLGRIGVAWMLGALIFMNTKNWKIRALLFLGILVLYWLIFVFFGTPGVGNSDHFSMEGNIASYIDRLILPGKLCCFGFGDNEGLLATLAAISTTLLGMLTGEFLNSNYSQKHKVRYMFISGLLLILVGWIWSFVFPINKYLWSSSFVCLVGGISILLLAVFYLIIDVYKLQKWSFPFIVIGMNPLTIYLVKRVFGFNNASKFLFKGIASLFHEEWSSVIYAIGVVIVGYLILLLLFKRKWFLKI